MHPAHQGFTQTWGADQLELAVWKRLLVQRIQEMRATIELQHERVATTRDARDPSDLRARADVTLYVIAVRDLVRAVEALNGRFSHPQLAASLTAFEAAV